MALQMVRGADDLSSRRGLLKYFVLNGLRRSPMRRFVPPPVEVAFSLGGVAWVLDPESSQLGGVHDVFLGNEYDALPGYVAQPGWIVVDAGANVGAYSLWQWRNMKKEGRIVAVEGSPVTRDVLAANLERNGADTAVTIVGAAVWSTSGMVDFVTSDRSSSTSGIRETLDTELVENADDQLVPALSLDDLFDRPELASLHIDVLKLDVEGAEEAVLRGAANDTLARVRRVVVEIDDRTWSGVRDVLSAAGFVHEGDHRRVAYFSRTHR